MTRCGLEASVSTGSTGRGDGCGRRHGYASGARPSVDGSPQQRLRALCPRTRYAVDRALRWRGRPV